MAGNAGLSLAARGFINCYTAGLRGFGARRMGYVVGTAAGFMLGFFVSNSTVLWILVPVVGAMIEAVMHFYLGQDFKILGGAISLGVIACGAATGAPPARRLTVVRE